MKTLPILVLSVLTINLYGQQKKIKSSSSAFNKIQLGVNFSSDINYRTLKNEGENSSTDIVLKARNENEIPKFGYTGGVSIGLNFNRFIGIETGIQYSNKGYQTKKK